MTEAFLVRHYGVPNLHLCREGYEYVVCPACGSHIVLERDFVDQWFEIEGDGWARVDEYDQTRVVLHTQCDWEHHGAPPGGQGSRRLKRGDLCDPGRAPAP